MPAIPDPLVPDFVGFAAELIIDSGTVCHLLSISNTTLSRVVENGELKPRRRTPTGRRFYRLADVYLYRLKLECPLPEGSGDSRKD